MPARKGTRPPNAGKGRRKGVPNRTTLSTREALTLFVERNANEAQVLFDRVKKRQPAVALALFGRLAEFVLPKLQRTELKADLTHSHEFTGEVQTISDPIEAALTYQELITGGRDLRSVEFVVSEQKPAAQLPPIPEPVVEPRPRFESDPEPVEAAEPATNIVPLEPQHQGEHQPVVDSKCPWCRKLWVKQQAVAHGKPVSPTISADPAPDTAVVNREDERLRHLRPPRVVT
jgi:hypothetical protein